MISPNPFAVLGLPEWPDLEDETVRAAWQQIAAETHPDRPDGGDLPRYTQACAAFAVLNTPWGRSEAFADLLEQAWADGRYDDPDTPWSAPAQDPVVLVLRPVPLREVLRILAAIPGRFRRGHPARLLVRAAVITGLCFAALALFHGTVLNFALAILAGVFAVSIHEDMEPAGPYIYVAPMDDPAHPDK